jgi:hypothetical protein
VSGYTTQPLKSESSRFSHNPYLCVISTSACPRGHKRCRVRHAQVYVHASRQEDTGLTPERDRSCYFRSSPTSAAWPAFRSRTLPSVLTCIAQHTRSQS